MKNHPLLGVVILGAGASSRMGKPKLLLPWRGTTIIGQIISQWRELGAAQIAIVHRPNDTGLFAELKRLNFPNQNQIENPQPERGMCSSIACAANWRGWKNEITNFVITLGDQPHLHSEILRELLEFSAKNPAAICQPKSNGHERHPVVLPRKIFDELKNSRAESLKNFLASTSCHRIQFNSSDPGLALDLDTPEDYQRAQSAS